MILVTGGTGFVGQEVVGRLLALGYRVRLLARDPQRAGRFKDHPQVEWVTGDALRPETLPAAMAGARGVIHLIGIIAETSRVTFEQAHVEATRNVLSAATQAGVTRWIQMSALGTRPDARSRYHQTKWEAEELVRQSGLDWTIFRPSLIYGYNERDRFLNLLRRVIRLQALPLPDGGRSLVQPVNVREVAHCFAHAPSKEAAIGQTYDLAGPVPFSWREMIFKILAILDRKGVYEEIPLLLLLRKLLWLATILIPILILAGLAAGRLSFPIAEIVAGVWVVLAVTAWRWRRVILFNVPTDLLGMASEGLDAFLPRALRFSEQLKMAQEDNVGDPGPAAKTFAYVPESFEQGAARVLRAEVALVTNR